MVGFNGLKSLASDNDGIQGEMVLVRIIKLFSFQLFPLENFASKVAPAFVKTADCAALVPHCNLQAACRLQRGAHGANAIRIARPCCRGENFAQTQALREAGLLSGSVTPK